MNAQQRPARNRRRLTQNQPRHIAQPFIAVGEIQSAHVIQATIGVVATPIDAEFHTLPFVGEGLAAFRRMLNGDMATATVSINDGAQMLITFGGAALNEGETIGIGPFDPTFRTADGGYIAPCIFRLVAAP